MATVPRSALAALAIAALLAVPATTAAAPAAGTLSCGTGVEGAKVDPVLLVPAYSTDRESYAGNYLDALPARGIPTCSVTFPDRGFRDLQDAAEYTAGAIREVARRSGRTVRLLGHQHGALNELLALRFWPDTVPLVSDVVTLATPHRGTRFAADVCRTLTRCAPSVWQIAQGSRLVAAMNRDPLPAGPGYTSIATAFDEVITPQPEASTLAGGRTILLQDLCPGRPVEHFTILGDALAMRLALDAFEHPGPADPARLTDPCADPADDGASGFGVENLSFVPNFLARNLTEAVGAEPALRCPFAPACGPPAVGVADAPAASCRSRRRFTVTVPRGVRAVRATLDGKARRVRSRRVTVDLRGRARGTATLRLIGRRADGRVYRSVRRYRTCSARR